MKTSDSLGIYWPCIDKVNNEIYQDEVSGLIFYGFWSHGYSSEVLGNVDSFENIWMGGVDIRFREWSGEAMSNLSIEMKINSWPSKNRWRESIEASLRWFIENGALISWCGGEWSSPSLAVFMEDQRSGLVYAAFCKSVGFAWGSDLESEYRDVEGSELRKFEQVVNRKLNK